MAVEIVRIGLGTWTGDRSGNGTASTNSGVIKDVPITVATRFQEEPGTNPEEMLAAAHAACFSMQLGVLLGRANTPAEVIRTRATLQMHQVEGGWQIYKIHLGTEGVVAGIDEAAFIALADKAKETCPVSKLLRPGLEELSISARLMSA
jgi:osmotically inducible protein OsmC